MDTHPALMADALDDIADAMADGDIFGAPEVSTTSVLIDDPMYCARVQCQMIVNLFGRSAAECHERAAYQATEEGARGVRHLARSMGLPVIGGAR